MVMGAQRARTLSPPESAPDSAPDQDQAGADRLEWLGPALARYGMTASLVPRPAGYRACAWWTGRRPRSRTCWPPRTVARHWPTAVRGPPAVGPPPAR